MVVKVAGAAFLFTASMCPGFAAVVSFDTENGGNTSARWVLTESFQEDLYGIWSEAGFEVTWTQHDDGSLYQQFPYELDALLADRVYELDPESISAHTGFTSYVAGENYTPNVESVGLNFSRPDGQPFSLKSFEVDGGTYFHGKLVVSDSVAGSVHTTPIEVVFDNVLLEGTRSDGSTTSLWTRGVYTDDLPIPGLQVLNEMQTSTLSDLVELDVSVGWKREGFMFDSLVHSGIDPLLSALIAESCPTTIYDAFFEPYCSRSFDNGISFDLSIFYSGNIPSASHFGAFTFELESDEDLSPVPLPATLPLLASALGFVGIRRLKARAS